MFAPTLKVFVRGATLASTATILIAHQTTAQTSGQTHHRVEFAPMLGGYVPTRGLYSRNHGWACQAMKGGPPCPDVTPDVRQMSGSAIGGRVTLWLNTQGAIEGSFWLVSSGVHDVTGFEKSIDGNIAGASLRYVRSVFSHAPKVSLLLMGGPGVVQRSGDAWTYTTGTRSLAGVLGMALDLHPVRTWGLRATVEGYYYSPTLNNDPIGGGPWQSQEDVVASLSLSVRP
jgi:hypothetical protein